MTWIKPVVATITGAGITLGSTVVSCSMALQVEKSAHRLFYWYAPQWYANVDRAYGLTDEQLLAARRFLPAQPMAFSPKHNDDAAVDVFSFE